VLLKRNDDENIEGHSCKVVRKEGDENSLFDFLSFGNLGLQWD
jgi:hypothetical protein